MKGLGVIMTIAGAALGIIGYIKYSSWEYQLASAYGLDSSAEIMLYGGIGTHPSLCGRPLRKFGPLTIAEEREPPDGAAPFFYAAGVIFRGGTWTGTAPCRRRPRRPHPRGPPRSGGGRGA